MSIFGNPGAQQPPQLPADPTRVNQGAFVQGVPNSLPIAPPFQPKNQNQAELTPICTGLIMAELQHEAYKNPLRTFCFNLISGNNWNNPHFTEIIESVVEYAEMLILGHRLDPQQAVSKAVKDVIPMFTALMVQRYPGLEQYIPAGGQQEIQRLLGELGQMAASIHAFKQGAQPPQAAPSPQGHYQQPQGYYQQPQQPQGYYQQPQQPQGYGQQWQQPRQPNVPMGVPPQAPQQPHRSGYLAARGVSNQQTPHQDMFQQPQQNAPQQEGSSVRGSAYTRRHPSISASLDDYDQPQQPQQPAQQPPQNFQGVDMTTGPVDEDFSSEPFEDFNQPQEPQVERKWDRRVVSDKGLTYIPAHLSDWTPEGSFHPAYDPTTHVLFHVFNTQGQAREVVMPIEEGMEYLAHETSPNKPKNLPPVEDGKVVPIDEVFQPKATKLPANLEEVDEEVLKDIKESKKAIVLPEVFCASSAHDAMAQARLYMSDQKLNEQWSARPIQFSYYLTYPLVDQVVDKEDGKEVKLSEVLKATLELESVTEYHAQLVKLSRNRLFPRDVLHMLNKYSTDAVNDALKYGILSDWNVDSFLEDWTELQAGFVEEYGDQVGVELRNKLIARRGREIIAGGLCVLTGELREKAFGEEGVLARYRKRRKDIVAIGQFRTEAHVPFDAAQLSIALEEGANTLRRTALPNLYDAVLEMVRGGKQSFGKFQKLWISTNDNLKIEVQEGILNKEYFILKTK